MNINKILLLSGTPASGKDSVTSELTKLNPKFIHFKKHKIATGGKLDNTYILVEKKEFDNLAQNDKFLQYHYRYDRGYGVSRTELESNWKNSFIPIIHVGKYENIDPFFQEINTSVISVLLLTSIEETKKRLVVRYAGNDQEISARLVAYTEERQELANLISSGEKVKFNLILENSDVCVSQVASIISKIL